MNYVPNDLSEDDYVKELRCDNNNTSFYYLRLTDGKIIIEEEDNT